MRAVTCHGFGGEEVMRVGEMPTPTPEVGQLRIRVAGAGVNRADLLQRRGLYPPPPGASQILGLECSGRVDSLGPGVAGFHEGDRVMALLAGGGYAEQVIADAGNVIPVPDHLDDIEAAAVPEGFLTAFLNLFMLGGLRAGETALIHGGSGGVGTAAIQLCKEAGATAFVTAGSAERCRRCEELGATRAVDYHTEDFVEAIRECTDGGGVDVILDCIGASYLARNIEVLSTGGRLVLIGLMGGARAEIDLRAVLGRRLQLIGSTLRGLPTERKSAIVASFLETFGGALESGAIRPVVDHALPFEEAAEAHRRLAAGRVFGKLVLTTDV